MEFKDFNFKPKLQEAIDNIGFVEPSPIQKEAIPKVLDGLDVVAQAHTGTGKTAAFALPILEKIGNEKALIIVPTRELAMQVSDEIYKFGKFLNINSATIYGGQSYSRQIKHIEKSQIIVATPGRLLDLIKNKNIEIKPKFIVLDEADEMLDMGFLDDIKEIFTFMPKKRQTLLFSATMPNEIKELAKKILKDPVFITITKNEITNENIKQNFYVVDEKERDIALVRLLDYKDVTKGIIFCRTKKEVDRLSTFLISQGYLAKGLHGDMEQRQREEVIRAFKTNQLELLVATDVAARGLDISDITHVFNYHIPFDNESYVHRIGRTGRAGKEGIAVSLVTPEEFHRLMKIQKHIGVKLQDKVIPDISSLKRKKLVNLVQEIRNTKIKEESYDLVENLKDLGDEALLLLASYILKDNIIGQDKIGKDKKYIKRLIQRHSQTNKNKNKSRNRNRRRWRR